MSKVIYPTTPLTPNTNPLMVDVFMAGSIEMGVAVDWQPSATDVLEYIEPVRNVFNPRRLDWDSSQPQTIDNPYFASQVNWEMDGLDMADVVYMYFDPNTRSPVTMAELGYLSGVHKATEWNKMAMRKDFVICCPEGFWRKGNIDIICQRASIEVLTDFEQSLKVLATTVWKKHLQKANWYGYIPYAYPWETRSDREYNDAAGRGRRFNNIDHEAIRQLRLSKMKRSEP